MSKGRILKPKELIKQQELATKSIPEIVYRVIQSCVVDVENGEWQNGDKKLAEILKANEKRFIASEKTVAAELQVIKENIIDLVSNKPIEISINLENEKKIDLGLQHFQFPSLVKMASTGLNIFLVGPAGSGKTTAAKNIAEAFGIDFHFTGAIASEFKLTGFKNAHGDYVSTEFRKAYEHGGLFLFDEIDASYPQAVLACNAALSNDYMDFPDQRITRHEKFYCIAAANTYGQGADRQYVGRNQLDAASLDRFVFLDWKYDEKLESKIAGNKKWSKYVQDVRKVVEELKIRHVVSPRASIFGSKLLSKGINRDVVEQTCLWKGMDESTIQKIKNNLKKK